jgi:hypothetical protein
MIIVIVNAATNMLASVHSLFPDDACRISRASMELCACGVAGRFYTKNVYVYDLAVQEIWTLNKVFGSSGSVHQGWKRCR